MSVERLSAIIDEGLAISKSLGIIPVLQAPADNLLEDIRRHGKLTDENTDLREDYMQDMLEKARQETLKKYNLPADYLTRKEEVPVEAEDVRKSSLTPEQRKQLIEQLDHFTPKRGGGKLNRRKRRKVKKQAYTKKQLQYLRSILRYR